MKRWIAGIGVALLVASTTLSAQDGTLAARCADPNVQAGQPRAVCLAVAQAVEASQPQIGMVIAGGNPVLGAAGGGGLRLGVLPRIDVTGRVNLVFIRMPDILAAEAGTTVQRLNETLGIPAPAFAVDGAVGVFQGVGFRPGIGGLGAIDVLAGASWLPFRTLGLDGFGEESPDVAWGLGARVGLLRESFVAPGISVSLMRRRLGNVSFGDVCRGVETAFPLPADESECDGPGDAGEFAFDLTNWSTRVVIGKRLVGLGLLGGVGYDRYGSDVEYAFRSPDAEPDRALVVRPAPVDLRSSRWSVFGNVSYTFLLASLSMEAGWQQGDSPVSGFGQDARFDPRDGSFFGGAGLRLSF